MREALNRALNACFLMLDKTIVEFLFRLIRHVILDEEYFEMLRYTDPAAVVFEEFQAQFKAEFGFDSTTNSRLHGIFDFDSEWPRVTYILYNLEQAYPVLLQWLRT